MYYSHIVYIQLLIRTFPPWPIIHNKLTITEMTNKDQPLDADDLSSPIPQANLVMEDSENSASEDREDVPQMFARCRREISNQIDA